MVLLVVVVAIGLAFDFTNGFHDTANYVATWVGTRALSPRMAVARLRAREPRRRVRHDGGREDGRRRGSSTRTSRREQTVLAALLGAIVWNLLTWWLGLPSSSTHALIGGLVGAALVQSGTKGVQWHGIWREGHVPGAASPVIGFAGAFVLMVLIYRLFFRAPPGVAHRGFRHRAARLRDVGRVHARRERRAEDDGRDRARARTSTARSRASTSRRG